MSDASTVFETSATSESTVAGTFMERLRDRWDHGRTLLCVGLDPEWERLPASLRGDERDEAVVEAAIFAFTCAIADATADLACAYKPNAAFYEAHGVAGLSALTRLVAHIHARHPKVPVLLDAKRGDTGNTMRLYARAVYEVIGADAVTLHPYLGREGIEPFLAYSDRGAFLLCHTSNTGSGDLQMLGVRRADGGGGTAVPGGGATVGGGVEYAG